MVPGGGATEALAVPQVTVEEIGSAAFVLPDFEGQGSDPLWLPVVASETEFFVAEMSGLGDEEFGLCWTLPGGHYSVPESGLEPGRPQPCGRMPAPDPPLAFRRSTTVALGDLALALPGGMRDWSIIAAVVAAMILAFMCCCHRRIRPRPPPSAREESECPLLEEDHAPTAPAPPPAASSWRLATPLWGRRGEEGAPGASRDVSVRAGEPHESSPEYVTVTFVVPGG